MYIYIYIYTHTIELSKVPPSDAEGGAEAAASEVTTTTTIIISMCVFMIVVAVVGGGGGSSSSRSRRIIIIIIITTITTSSPKLIPTPGFLPPGYSLFSCVFLCFLTPGEILKSGVGITFWGSYTITIIRRHPWRRWTARTRPAEETAASEAITSVNTHTV